MVSLRRFARIVPLLALLVLLGACSSAVLMRVAYNNGDWALRLAAHEYFDLHGEQSDHLKERVNDFHAWHRRAELPQYAALARSASDRIGRGLVADDVSWAIERVRSRYRVLAEQAIAETTPLLAQLDAANITSLEKKLADNSAKWERDYLRGTPEKREQARLRSTTKRVEEFTGPLNREQEALIAAYVRDAPHFSPQRLQERRARQMQLVAMLREHRRDADLRDRLRNYFVQFDRNRTPEYVALNREWEGRITRLVLDLDKTLTREQRQNVIRRFDQLASDFAVLAGVPMPSAEPRRAALQ